MVATVAILDWNRSVFYVYCDDEDDETRGLVRLHFLFICDVGRHDDRYDGAGRGSYPDYFPSDP